MAEGSSMTTAEIVRRVMESEYSDWLCDAVEFVARELTPRGFELRERQLALR